MKTAKVKNYSILALFVLTLLSIWSANSVWLKIEFLPGVAAFDGITVSGADALAALFPILVAFLAIGATFFITRKVVRMILALLVLGLSVWIVQASLGVLFAGEEQAYRFGVLQITEATGLSAAQHSTLVAQTELTQAILAQAALGGLIGIVALIVLITGKNWPEGGRRYEKTDRAVETEVKDDRISAWDALSDGEDPSVETQ